jgi:hypothetical protein
MRRTDRRSHIDEWAALLDASVPDALPEDGRTDADRP